MDTQTLLTNLELIASRSTDAYEEATNAMRAVRVNSPMIEFRYERVVSLALADDAAKWTAAEKRALQSVWTDALDTEGLKLRSVRLSDADWERANQIGNGNAADGIRAALREYHQADD